MSKKEDEIVVAYPQEDVAEIIPNAIQRYGMEVIKNRALPNIISGLKPVQQRILFAMSQLGCYSNKPFVKSARIVGEVMGKMHP